MCVSKRERERLKVKVREREKEKIIFDDKTALSPFRVLSSTKRSTPRLISGVHPSCGKLVLAVYVGVGIVGT